MSEISGIGEICAPEAARRSARAGGRAARVAARAAPLAEDLRPVRPGLPGGQYKPLTEEGVRQIHAAALDALEQIGLSQAPPSGVEILTGAGAASGEEIDALLKRGEDDSAGRGPAPGPPEYLCQDEGA